MNPASTRASMPLILHLADVLELPVEEALRRRVAHLDERVERARVEVREVHASSDRRTRSSRSRARARACVSGPSFELPIWFGVKPGFASSPAIGSHVRDGVERPGRLAGFADRRAQLERLPLVARPEPVLGEHVRDADLRVRLEPEVLAERAVAVDAQAEREERAVVPAELLLQRTGRRSRRAAACPCRPSESRRSSSTGSPGPENSVDRHVRLEQVVLEQLPA